MKSTTRANEELIRSPAQDSHDLKLWVKFIQRFHEHLVAVLARELKRRSGCLGLGKLEALLIQVYRKLFAQSDEALQVFQDRSEASTIKYLEIIAIRIVLKHTGLEQPPRAAARENANAQALSLVEGFHRD